MLRPVRSKLAGGACKNAFGDFTTLSVVGPDTVVKCPGFPKARAAIRSLGAQGERGGKGAVGPGKWKTT